MDRQTELSKIILSEAKDQFQSGIIDFKQYSQVLGLVYDRLSEIEKNATKKKYFLQLFSVPVKPNVLDALNCSLSMN